MHIFKARNGTQKSILHINGHGRRHSLHVHFCRVCSFRLNKKLMTIFIGKANDLIFNGWTISRADTVNFSCIFRCAHDIITDNFMGTFIGVCEPTISDIFILSVVHKGKSVMIRIAFFQNHFIEMKCSAIDSTGCACFESEYIYAVLFEIFR